MIIVLPNVVVTMNSLIYIGGVKCDAAEIFEKRYKLMLRTIMQALAEDPPVDGPPNNYFLMFC